MQLVAVACFNFVVSQTPAADERQSVDRMEDGFAVNAEFVKVFSSDGMAVTTRAGTGVLHQVDIGNRVEIAQGNITRNGGTSLFVGAAQAVVVRADDEFVCGVAQGKRTAVTCVNREGFLFDFRA